MAEKWRSEKIRRTPEQMQPFADLLASEMPADVEWHFGGSYRRRAATVGDLDIVVITETGRFGEDLFDGGVALPTSVKFQRRGEKVAQGDLSIGEETIHVDFWAATPAERGAFLWFITGPKELNIAMRQAAIKKGLNLSQIGLLKDKVQIDKGTEYSVANMLGPEWVAWLDPEKRERWGKPNPAQLIQTYKVPNSKGTGIYVVMVDLEGKASCTCPAYKYRGGNCKHILQIKVKSEEVSHE